MSTAAQALPTTADVRDSWIRLREEARHFAVAKLDSWQRQAKGLVEPDGATDRAVVEAVKAGVTGNNPLKAALAGAWKGADGKTKAAFVATLVLLAVLAPVALLVVLLGLLVAAVVLKTRAAARGARG